MENIAFYLTPKTNVAYVEDDITLKQLIHKMEYHGYSSIPILDSNGIYIGTITEGDILRKIKSREDLSLKKTGKIPIVNINRRKEYKPVSINAKFIDLLSIIVNQNYVPVIDDQGVFIGIVTRGDIIEGFKKFIKE